MVPGRVPLLGHLHRMMRDMPSFMREAHERYGDFFRIDMGGEELLVVNRSDIAYELMQNKRVSSDILNEKTGPVLRGTLMGMDGSEHRRMRKAMGGPFRRSELDVSAAGAMIAQQTARMLEHWATADTCAVAQDTRRLGLSVIFRLIGAEPEALNLWAKKFRIMMFGGGRLPWPFSWRSRKARAWLDNELAKVIRHCRAEGIRDTVVGALAHGEDEDGQQLAIDELVPSLRLLVLAGYETSATTISWALLELAEHPEMWSRLVEEATAVERAPQRPTELAKVPFTVALGREVMRMYTPATVMLRRTTEPIELGGRTVEAGRGLFFSLHLLNRDPAIFPDPHVLRPERWLAPDAPTGPPQIAPFGGGPHTCLGMHLAHLEVAHVLVAVAKVMADAGRKPSRRGLAPPRCNWFPATRLPGDTQLWWVPCNESACQGSGKNL